MIPEDQQAKERLDEESNRDLIWILYVDGASNLQSSSIGLIITNLKRIVIKYALRFAFKASNNQVDYEALLTSLMVVKELSVKRLKVFTDSQLVVEQIREEYEAQEPIMIRNIQKLYFF